MLIRGKCHCGNVAFSLTWEPEPAEIPARACTCSFCTAHGAVWTSNPHGTLEIVVNEPTLPQPTAKQTPATVQSVVRSSAAARSSRRVSKY